jgi:hypothetical protein
MSSSGNNVFANRLAVHKNALKQIDGHKVEAGWFESARYKAGKGVSKDMVGLSIAQVAKWNEFGTSRAVESTSKDGKTVTTVVVHTPARPFMRYAQALFNKDRHEIQAKVGKKLIEGKITAVQALGQIGNALEGKIVLSIKTGPWPKNAPSTIAAKGFDAPLRDTSQMFQSVSSKVS